MGDKMSSNRLSQKVRRGIALSIAIVIFCLPASAASIIGTATRFYSGDFIQIRSTETCYGLLDASCVNKKKVYKIRLAGIAAPAQAQYLEQESISQLKWFLVGWNSGREVIVNINGTDKHGNPTGVVFVKGAPETHIDANGFPERNVTPSVPVIESPTGWVNVNLEMVRNGYAWATDLTPGHQLYDAMIEARRRHIGIWLGWGDNPTRNETKNEACPIIAPWVWIEMLQTSSENWSCRTDTAQ